MMKNPPAPKKIKVQCGKCKGFFTVPANIVTRCSALSNGKLCMGFLSMVPATTEEIKALNDQVNAENERLGNHERK